MSEPILKAVVYPSASEYDMAVITTCVNKQIAPHIIRTVLRDISLTTHYPDAPDSDSADGLERQDGNGQDSTGATSDHSVRSGHPQSWPYLTHYQKVLQQNGVEAADQYFERSYDKARNRGESQKARVARRDLARLKEWVATQKFVGRRSHKNAGRFTLGERAVLLAHIRRASQARSLFYALDVRTGAEFAGCSIATFQRATKTWQRIGVLKIARPPSRPFSLATRYQIVMPASLNETHPHKSGVNGGSVPIGTAGGAASEPREPSGALNDFYTAETHGVFEPRGVNRSGYSIYIWLLQHDRPEGWGRYEIARGVRFCSRTFRTALQRVQEFGLVRCEAGQYWAVPDPDFKSIAVRMGTIQRVIRRCKRHATDRQRHQAQMTHLRKQWEPARQGGGSDECPPEISSSDPDAVVSEDGD